MGGDVGGGGGGEVGEAAGHTLEGDGGGGVVVGLPLAEGRQGPETAKPLHPQAHLPQGTV